MKLNDKLEAIKVKKISKNALQYPNKITLCKDNEYENIKIDISKKLISASKQEDIELLKQKIKEFLIIMHTKCENFDDTLFIRNVKKTFFDISKTKKEIVDGDSDLLFYNHCNISKPHSFSYINNHFLHLTSFDSTEYSSYSKYSAYKRYLAFINDSFTLTFFDESLSFANSWYTQLLSERYFEKNEGDLTHVISTIILNQIEHVLGKDFLEKSYFNGNFKLDLFTLSHYIPRKDFITLFDCIQDIYNIEEEIQMGNPYNKDKMQTLLLMISTILFNCIKTKIYTIDGIDNQIEFLNSNKCMYKAIILSSADENITFDFYDEEAIDNFYKELKSMHVKIKEIN